MLMKSNKTQEKYQVNYTKLISMLFERPVLAVGQSLHTFPSLKIPQMSYWSSKSSHILCP